MSLLNELHSLMVKYRFRPNKRLAQHFIINEKTIDKLVDLAELKKNDIVLEIGPGTGFLTRELLKKCKVVAVEIDETLCTLLEEELPKKSLTLVKGDFLKQHGLKFNKAVSLPPYGHSAAIVLHMLRSDFELAILVFQREFAEKLVALPGFEQYNALSVLTQYEFESRLVGSVPAGCFFPKPQDESYIVRLKASKRFGKAKDKEAFSLFVKTLFRFQNKNLKNALLKSGQFLLESLKLNEEEFGKRVTSLKLREKKVNILSVQEFVDAFNQIMP